jgi:hypothetical protein
MQVGVFLTNQNPVGSDMVAALEEQLAMTGSPAIAAGTWWARGSTI